MKFLNLTFLFKSHTLALEKSLKSRFCDFEAWIEKLTCQFRRFLARTFRPVANPTLIPNFIPIIPVPQKHKEYSTVWMSHVAYGWIMSHMNESCHAWMSHVTRVMSSMNESCHTIRVTSRTSMCDEWGWYESCHIWMSHVAYEWVMSNMNESCHTIRVTSRTSMYDEWGTMLVGWRVSRSSG